MSLVGTVNRGRQGVFPVSLSPDFVGFNNHSPGDVC